MVTLILNAKTFLLVDGHPLEKLDLVADPGKTFALIMKNGNICKNTTN